MASLPLTGRDHELRVLRSALIRSPQQGSAFVVRGDPGVGKSRLVREIGEVARDQGMAVAVGAVFELEHQRPFAALADAFAGPEGSAAPALAFLGGARGTDPPGGREVEDLRYRIVEEALAYVESRLRDGPLLLVLEDLHWADPSTHLFVRHTVRRLLGGPLVLVGTRRPWPRVPELDRIEEMDRVTVIPLSPLSEGEVLSMVDHALGGPPPEELRERLRGAGGNPLFVEEVLVATSTGDGGHGHPPPEDFASSVTRRLSYLSEGCFHLLRIASVLGSRFRFRDLATAMRRSPTDLAPVMDEAVRSGLVGEAGDALRFNHDLVRDAVYRDIPQDVRRTLHLQVGRDLAAGGAAATQVAPHFVIGADAGDEAAIGWIWRAAREAAPRAPSVAVDLLLHALELSPPGPPHHDGLLADLVTALLWSGQFYRAEARAEELLSRPHDPAAGAAVRYSLARVLVYRGDVAASLAQLEAAVERERLPEDQRARTLADEALRGLVLGEVRRASAAADSGLDIAERLGDPSATALALCARARVAEHRGFVAEAVDMASRAVAMSVTAPRDAIQFVQPSLYLGMSLVAAARFADARAEFERGRRAAETVGASWSLPLFHLGSALALFHGGSWDDALAEAEAGVALARETGTWVWLAWTRAVIARICLHRDDRERARAEMAGALLQEGEAGCAQFGAHWIRWSEALLAEVDAGPVAARDVLAAEWDRWPEDEPVGDHRETAADMARWAGVDGGDVPIARVVRCVEEAAARWPAPPSEAMALACRAWVETDGDLHERAGRGFATAGMSLPAARSLEWAADSAGADRAGTLLREAIDLYERLDARRDTARVEARLRALGYRRGRRGPRQRPPHGWGSLTQTERRVVSLIAEGLTNREIGERLFVSHRTVETHVSHALAKLGASSRAEIAAEAARRAGGLADRS